MSSPDPLTTMAFTLQDMPGHLGTVTVKALMQSTQLSNGSQHDHETTNPPTVSYAGQDETVLDTRKTTAMTSEFTTLADLPSESTEEERQAKEILFLKAEIQNLQHQLAMTGTALNSVTSELEDFKEEHDNFLNYMEKLEELIQQRPGRA